MNGVVLLKAQLFQIKSDQRTKFRILVTGAFLFAYHGNGIAAAHDDDDHDHNNKEVSRMTVNKKLWTYHAESTLDMKDNWWQSFVA